MYVYTIIERRHTMQLKKNPTVSAPESLEPMSMEEFDDFVDPVVETGIPDPDIQDFTFEQPVSIDPVTKPALHPPKPSHINPSPAVRESSFKKHLQELKKANSDAYEKVQKEIERQIIDYDVTFYVLPTGTKPFILEKLKKEGLKVEGNTVKFNF